jgi:hypothetical protein
MKNILCLFVCVIIGCSSPPVDNIKYTRSNSGIKLVITHSNRYNSLDVEINNLQDANNYKDRLQKIIKELERFEDEARIMEK